MKSEGQLKFSKRVQRELKVLSTHIHNLDVKKSNLSNLKSNEKEQLEAAIDELGTLKSQIESTGLLPPKKPLQIIVELIIKILGAVGLSCLLYVLFVK